MADIKDFLKQISDLWLKQVELCREAKDRDFANSAREVMKYVGKRYRRIGIISDVNDVIDEGQTPWITVSNYTAAFVDVMAPYVFAKVPNRLVSPRRPQVPPELESILPQVVGMQKQMKEKDSLVCFLLQWWLQWSPDTYKLAKEGRMAVEEALAKGRGTLWVELVDGPTGEIPACMCDTVDNLFIDSDCKQMREAGFIFRKRDRAIWRIAEEFGEDPDVLRATSKSNFQQAVETYRSVKAVTDSSDPSKGDIATYYEFWSVMGLGHKLVDASDDMKDKSGDFLKIIEQAGPYVHFCVMPGLDHPLGMKPEMFTSIPDSEPEQRQQLINAALEWPIKTYGNYYNPWPVYCCDFKPNVDNPWARSILEAGLPLQEFVDRIYQTMLNRARSAGRDIILYSAELEAELTDAVEDATRDLRMVKINDANVKKVIDELVGFLQFPEMNKDIPMILAIVDKAWREIVGLPSALFGEVPSTQDRSAQATNVREAGISRRPDDYADTVENWCSEYAAGEGIATRLLVDPATIAPLFGEQELVVMQDDGEPFYGNCPLTSLWIQHVMTDDPYVAASECEYTIEAGSGRRKNKQLFQQNAKELYTMMSANLYDIGKEMGNFTPYFALVQLMGDAFDMPTDVIIEKFKEALSQVQTPPPVAIPEEPPPEGANYG